MENNTKAAVADIKFSGEPLPAADERVFREVLETIAISNVNTEINEGTKPNSD